MCPAPSQTSSATTSTLSTSPTSSTKCVSYLNPYPFTRSLADCAYPSRLRVAPSLAVCPPGDDCPCLLDHHVPPLRPVDRPPSQRTPCCFQRQQVRVSLALIIALVSLEAHSLLCCRFLQDRQQAAVLRRYGDLPNGTSLKGSQPLAYRLKLTTSVRPSSCRDTRRSASSSSDSTSSPCAYFVP